MKPYVTEEQIRAAKAVNTLAFLLRHQPERFKRVGCTEHAHCDHDSLKVSSNGKWNWHSMCVRAAESPSFGKSIFDYDPRGKATLAYEQLAGEVLTLGRKKELGRGGFAPTR